MQGQITATTIPSTDNYALHGREIASLKSLSRNNIIIIPPPDKGGGGGGDVVIIDCTYYNKIMELINDKNTNKQIAVQNN